IYQMFDTADEPLTLGLGNDRIWSRFWRCVGDEAYGRNPRFVTNALRREHRAEIVEHIQVLLMDKPRADWLTLFARARVPAGPVNRLDQVAQDDALFERSL